MQIYQSLVKKEKKLAVIGLGYVGLPVALAFAKHLSVIGFDISDEKIQLLKQSTDPSKEVPPTEFENSDITFTSCQDDLKNASFFIVAVPSPVDQHKVPDLSFLRLAATTVGQTIKKGDYVVFETTVYPGCTEEECLPLIENASGLRSVSDFKVGYSPERINPGDTLHTLTNTVKIVSACDDISLEEIAKTYQLVVKAGVHRTTSIKVAEAAKIVENTQRDVNISLINELSLIFDRAGINTFDVIDAASTKWNFMKYSPGLVGGHCIAVDPYYLAYKAQQLGFNSRVIAAGRFINDEMPRHVARKVVQHVIKNADNTAEARILVLGATFKENIRDIRNSKVADMVKDLLDYSLQVDFVDYLADPIDVKREYGLDTVVSIGKDYDAVILAVAHDDYKNFSEEFLLSITRPNALFADLKGIYRNRFSNIKYWSL